MRAARPPPHPRGRGRVRAGGGRCGRGGGRPEPTAVPPRRPDGHTGELLPARRLCVQPPQLSLARQIAFKARQRGRLRSKPSRYFRAAAYLLAGFLRGQGAAALDGRACLQRPRPFPARPAEAAAPSPMPASAPSGCWRGTGTALCRSPGWASLRLTRPARARRRASLRRLRVRVCQQFRGTR